ncbi:MAG: pyroglutamyl-peptidase I [Fervidobacterium sp.]
MKSIDSKLFQILVTGFEKFGGERLNPSEKIVRKIGKMGKKLRENILLDTLILPVSYDRSIKVLEDFYSKTKVDFVLHIGQSGGRATISLERIAINLMDSLLADNDNITLSNKKVIQEGQDAYMTNVKVKDLAQFLNSKNTPTSISYTAGQYICNEVYYFSLHRSITCGNPKYVLFVHVPFLPEQVAEKYPKNDIPSMPLSLQYKAIVEVIKHIEEFI